MLSHKLSLIGYVRTGDTTVSANRQKLLLQQYCADHHWNLIGFTQVDSEKPSFGLQQGLRALVEADGIIALDLDRFINHTGDRLLDLRPLVRQFMHSKKVLVTLRDGIETITAYGQANIIEMLNKWNDPARDNIVQANFIANLSHAS